jgi:hypothetical protein
MAVFDGFERSRKQRDRKAIVELALVFAAQLQRLN